MRYVLALVLCVGLCGGCDGDKAGKKIIEVSAKTAAALDRGEPVFLKLQDAVGVPLVSGEVADKGVVYANNASRGLTMASGIASFVPGGQPVAGVLEGLGVLAAAVGGFFARRKIKSGEKALGSVIKAVNPYGGIGAVIQRSAVNDGVADIVHDSYVKNVPSKL